MLLTLNPPSGVLISVPLTFSEKSPREPEGPGAVVMLRREVKPGVPDTKEKVNVASVGSPEMLR